jgi:hypothetical protein
MRCPDGILALMIIPLRAFSAGCVSGCPIFPWRVCIPAGLSVYKTHPLTSHISFCSTVTTLFRLLEYCLTRLICSR